MTDRPQHDATRCTVCVTERAKVDRDLLVWGEGYETSDGVHVLHVPIREVS